MNATQTKTPQWPDNIVAGKIRYGHANNYDGFFLADAQHGIPTFGSVAQESPATIRGQFVRVFNYPGQTEQIAAELVKRWNSHDELVKLLSDARFYVPDNARPVLAAQIDAALASQTGG